MHWPDDKLGRVLVVGDIHGEFRMLQHLLKVAEFDERRDFVYALGDLIDRGPDSRKVLDWFADDLGRSRASLMGNHDALMVGAEYDWYAERAWAQAGGDWANGVEQPEIQQYRSMIGRFPLTAEIQYGERLRVGLVHAEVRAGLSWSQVRKVRLQQKDAANDWLDTASACAIWGRSRFLADALLREDPNVSLPPDRKVRCWRNLQPVKGIDLVISGHTVIADGVIRGRGNVLWIDTGAAYGGRLTAIDPLARVYWQVGREGEYWGPMALPNLEPVLPTWRPTRKEREQAKELNSAEDAARLKASRLFGFR